MINKPIQLILGFLITLLFISCSAEDNLNQSQTYLTVEKAKVWHESDLNISNLKIIEYTKDIHWDKAIVTNGEKGQIIEVPITLLDLVSTTNTGAKKLKDHHRLLFTKSDKEIYNCYDLQIFTNDNNFDNFDTNFNFYNIKEDFNGFITMYDPTKRIVASQKFKEGKFPKPELTAKEDTYATCTYLGWIYEDGHFEVIEELYCTGGGSGGGVDGNNGGYGGGSTSGASSGETNGTQGNSTVSEIIVERIITDSLAPCPKEVLETLKNATNNDIVNILKNLDQIVYTM